MKVNLPELVPAAFVRRLHRFGALVHLDGEETLAHLANPGRMRELLLPGVRVWVERLRGKKCRCRVWLMEKDRTQLARQERVGRFDAGGSKAWASR